MSLFLQSMQYQLTNPHKRINEEIYLSTWLCPTLLANRDKKFKGDKETESLLLHEDEYISRWFDIKSDNKSNNQQSNPSRWRASVKSCDFTALWSVHTILSHYLTIHEIYIMRRVCKIFRKPEFLPLYEKGMIIRGKLNGKVICRFTGTPMINMIQESVVQAIERCDIHEIQYYSITRSTFGLPPRLISYLSSTYTLEQYNLISRFANKYWPSLKFPNNTNIPAICMYELSPLHLIKSSQTAFLALKYISKSKMDNTLIRGILRYLPIYENLLTPKIRQYEYKVNNRWISSIDGITLNKLKILSTFTPTIMENDIVVYANETTNRYSLSGEIFERYRHIEERFNAISLSYNDVINTLFP